MALPPFYLSEFISPTIWTFQESTNGPAAAPSAFFITNTDSQQVFSFSNATITAAEGAGISTSNFAPELDPIAGFVPVIGRNYRVTITMRKTLAATNGVSSWFRPGFIAYPNADLTNGVIIGPSFGEGFTIYQGATFIDTQDWIVGQYYQVGCNWIADTTYFQANPRIRINRNQADTLPYSNAEHEFLEFKVQPEIALSDIKTEFGGNTPAKLSDYYLGGTFVSNISNNAAVPTSGVISLSDFYGASATGVASIAAPVWSTAAGSLGSFSGNIPPTQLTATDSGHALTYSVTSGSLPAGVTITSSGVISGVATVTGTSSFVVTVSNGTNSTSRSFSITTTAGTGTGLTANFKGNVYSSTDVNGNATTYSSFTLLGGTTHSGTITSGSGYLNSSGAGATITYNIPTENYAITAQFVIPSGSGPDYVWSFSNISLYWQSPNITTGLTGGTIGNNDFTSGQTVRVVIYVTYNDFSLYINGGVKGGFGGDTAVPPAGSTTINLASNGSGNALTTDLQLFQLTPGNFTTAQLQSMSTVQ